VDNYVVTASGPGLSTTRDVGTATTASFDGLASGQSYSFTVSARNDAARNGTAVQWNSAGTTATAVGAPSAPGGVNASGQSNGNGTQVTVNFSGSDGGGTDIREYRLYRLSSSSFDCSSAGSGDAVQRGGTGTRSFTDTPGDESDNYYAVVAVNALGFCASSVVGPVQSYVTPSGPKATVSTPDQSDTDGHIPVTVSDLSVDRGQATYYRVSLVGGGSVISRGEPVTLLPSAENYGKLLDVTVMACRLPNNDGQYCTDDKRVGSAMPLNTRASAVAPTAGGTIALNSPQNAGSHIVSYKISVCTGGFLENLLGCATDGSDGKPYSEGSTLPTNAAFITVQATVDNKVDSNPATVAVAPAADPPAADPPATPTP
jgi:hypothetical protein